MTDFGKKKYSDRIIKNKLLNSLSILPLSYFMRENHKCKSILIHAIKFKSKDTRDDLKSDVSLFQYCASLN